MEGVAGETRHGPCTLFLELGLSSNRAWRGCKPAREPAVSNVFRGLGIERRDDWWAALRKEPRFVHRFTVNRDYEL